jgi:HEAT repeat protein
MAFYYPQDVTEENGPSAVLPGTQYYMTRSNDNSEVELPILGEAGTVTIIHFDLWHRATPNRTDKSRFMMKFQFVRMQEPQRPSWNSKDPLWHPVEDVEDVEDNDKALFDKHQALWIHIWDWMHGRKAKKSSADVLDRSDRSDRSGIMAQSQGAQNHRSNLSVLVKRLSDGSEPVRLKAAYTLAALGETAVPSLIEALFNDSEPTRLAAAYGLGAVGSPAISALIEALSDKSEPVRRYASYALAQMGQPAQDAIAALIKVLADESSLVRQYATETLGIIGQSASEAVLALIEKLHDKDGLVRANAALALAQVGKVAKAAVPELIKALKDENRYVRFNAAVALNQIATPEAKAALLRFLYTSRWCPLTTKESTF